MSNQNDALENQDKEREDQAIPANIERGPPRKITYDSAVRLSGNMIEVNYQRFSEDVGVTDHNFMRGIAKQIEALSSVGEDMKEENIKFMYAILASFQPRDPFEVLLATQMATSHLLAVRCGVRGAKARTPEEIESAEKAMSRAMRTFAMQIAALGSHRVGPSTQVNVGNVTVEDGGQAVVGAVVKGKS